MVFLLYKILLIVASAGARWLNYNDTLVKIVTEACVQIEAVTLRLRASLIDDTYLTDDENSTDEHEEMEGFIGPVPLGLPSDLARIIIIYLLIFPLTLALIVASGLL